MPSWQAQRQLDPPLKWFLSLPSNFTIIDTFLKRINFPQLPVVVNVRLRRQCTKCFLFLPVSIAPFYFFFIFFLHFHHICFLWNLWTSVFYSLSSLECTSLLFLPKRAFVIVKMKYQDKPSSGRLFHVFYYLVTNVLEEITTIIF